MVLGSTQFEPRRSPRIFTPHGQRSQPETLQTILHKSCSSFKHPNECTHHLEHLRHDLRGVVPPSVHRNPSLAIKEGDLIVAVNGVLGSSGAMSAAMGAAKVLVLDVERASFASLPRARQDNPVLA